MDVGYIDAPGMVPVLVTNGGDIKTSPCPVCGRSAELRKRIEVGRLGEPFEEGERFRVGCLDCGLFGAHWVKDKNAAIAEWERGELRATELTTVIFPSDYFNPEAVDPDYRQEYDAVLENEWLTPILFNYEAWFQNGKLSLSELSDAVRGAVYRGWMMKPEQYGRFYEELRKQKVYLMTNPKEYSTLHMLPNIYEQLREDTARIMTFPLHAKIDVALLKKSFKRFMVKDYVKSVKGTEFPAYFDESITQDEFDRWMKVFYEYRGDLLTGGICVKEYLELKWYGGKTNEYRMFCANKKEISLEPNSCQGALTPKPPIELLEKYCFLDSPFYTVDFGELADGTWKIIETGDGGVSGLSDGQDARPFYRALRMAFR